MAEIDVEGSPWSALCRLLWCWLRRHPRRYISWWLVKPTREGGCLTSSGPTSGHDVAPFVAVTWTCPTCGRLRLDQVT